MASAVVLHRWTGQNDQGEWRSGQVLLSWPTYNTRALVSEGRGRRLCLWGGGGWEERRCLLMEQW